MEVELVILNPKGIDNIFTQHVTPVVSVMYNIRNGVSHITTLNHTYDVTYRNPHHTSRVVAHNTLTLCITSTVSLQDTQRQFYSHNTRRHPLHDTHLHTS